jgi:ADP-heptose:LPS heptosyltransferase
VLATLWGFGKPVLRIAQLVRARRKIYLDGRYAAAYPEWPPHSHYDTLTDPAWFVTQVFDPSAVKPQRLEIASLAKRRQAAPKPGAVGIIPVADERRRTFDAPTLANLLTEVSARHPGKPVWLIVNPNDRGAKELIATPLPAHVEVKRFPTTLADLLLVLFQLDAYYGTDTGIYHLAAAMGIPATVFSGPTQPLRVIMPQQPNVTSIRLAALGNEHCEVKQCTRPLCLYQAVATFVGTECATRLEDTPAQCPLRAADPAQLSAITRRENPRH